MFNSQLPATDDLPTSRQLLRSTVVALAVALLLLVTVVMPAEYAVDPTGVGRLLGLTQMGEVKLAIAEENEGPAVASPDMASPAASAIAAVPETVDAPPSAAARRDEISITLQPGQGAEVKLEMKKDAQVNYLWSVSGGKVNYDTHGDPYGAPRDFYHGYSKGKQTSQDEGVLTAAFDGKHGWFWRNRGDTPVTVTLRVSGEHIDIKRVI